MQICLGCKNHIYIYSYLTDKNFLWQHLDELDKSKESKLWNTFYVGSISFKLIKERQLERV